MPHRALKELAFLDHDSDMARRMRAHDWAATALGPPAGWPEELKGAVSTCLSSQFPMLVCWGDDLLELYNDGYRQLLGDKHPEALGRATREVWAEIWADIEPVFAGVHRTGRASLSQDQRLLMARHGFEEETYFTYSYSPIVDAGGAIAGILNIVTETTAQVLAQRRLASLGRVAGHGGTWREAAGEALAVLVTAGEDLPAAELRRRDEVVASAGDVPPPDPGPVPPATGDRPLPRTSVDIAIALPAGREPVTLRLALNPRLPFDADYAEFCALAAGSVGGVVAASLALEEERARATVLADHAARLQELLDREHHIAETLQRSLLPSVMNSAAELDVAARYAPARDAPAVGGDWYDATPLADGRVVLTVGDVAGHGLEAAATMGRLRAATSALARVVAGPGPLLEQLNALAGEEDGALATCLVAYVDAGAGTVVLASAGHPPAVRAQGEHAEALRVVPGPPLGALEAARYTEARHELPAGSRLLMLTDGVVERRSEVLDVGLERVRRCFERLEGAPGAVAERVLDAQRPDAGWADDAAVLVANVGARSL